MLLIRQIGRDSFNCLQQCQACHKWMLNQFFRLQRLDELSSRQARWLKTESRNTGNSWESCNKKVCFLCCFLLCYSSSFTFRCDMSTLSSSFIDGTFIIYCEAYTSGMEKWFRLYHCGYFLMTKLKEKKDVSDCFFFLLIILTHPRTYSFVGLSSISISYF